ncbi:MAG TPA: hypothetical protein VEJ86_02080 [Candidatus Binataceae bacterium]|nr:hypothetical protein [Candidatus Binataceae bacterium]
MRRVAVLALMLAAAGCAPAGAGSSGESLDSLAARIFVTQRSTVPGYGHLVVLGDVNGYCDEVFGRKQRVPFGSGDSLTQAAARMYGDRVNAIVDVAMYAAHPANPLHQPTYAQCAGTAVSYARDDSTDPAPVEAR